MSDWRAKKVAIFSLLKHRKSRTFDSFGFFRTRRSAKWLLRIEAVFERKSITAAASIDGASTNKRLQMCMNVHW
ncbi:hypothetical protein RMSM_00974 [Rhodopirellula maiorica SM1]|uniref:Uncharacterized protein n=1 Tax=Rhodopirellula maiorica SM1 TaxID=1265738 RepID=M5S385_9BACT|nr:hypothetical protein [Rhodopirellula maiorica]EMI22097.1 hypothetical protein RMSM_00974 [Rhodopirellula maiorica SM1]